MTFKSYCFALGTILSMTVSAATQPMNFAEAVAKATDTAGCPPSLVTKIGYVSSSPFQSDDGTVGFTLWFAPGKDAESPQSIGPLKNDPTAEELASLRGKAMCDK